MSALWNEIVRLVAEHPVAQGVGLVALVATCLSYQARTTRGIALRQAVGAFFWTTHMLLLGAWTGGLLNFLGLVRSGIYSQRGARAWASRPFWPWLFGALCVAAAAWAGLSQGEGPRLLLSLAAQCLGCYALWTTRVRLARFLLVAVSLLWLAYDVLSGSIPGTACEVLGQLSLYVAIVRDFRALRFLPLREAPELEDAAADWFHDKWRVPREAYEACMGAYLRRETELGWYLCLDGRRIVGGLGVVENDFHDRKDLAPNVCAVYTEEAYRRRGIAGRLLDMAVEDLRAHGISPVYLLTDHVGFYERYGWEYLCPARSDGEANPSRMYVHR